MKTNLNKEMNEEFIRFQRDERTESIVCERLAPIEKDGPDRKVLRLISAEEKAHYATLKKYTGTSVAPNRMRIAKYYWSTRVLGITSTIRLMESSEENTHHDYAKYTDFLDLQQLAREEKIHKQKLVGPINEERLEYMGSVILSLNNALVEFIGALADFTLALSGSRLITLTGSITEIATALPMTSSEYLSIKSEGGEDKHPVKAAIYTGIVYIIMVAVLIAPFMLIENVPIALGVVLVVALMIIALFNYYYSVAHGESFRKRFTEITILNFSVTGISFLMGYTLKTFTRIDA